MKTGKGKVIPDHNLIFTDITVQVITIHTEATQGHNIGIITATTGAAHDGHAPPIEVTSINPTATHHIDNIADDPCIEVLWVTTPEITVDHTHDHPTNLQDEMDVHRSSSHSSRSWGKPHLKKNPRVKSKDPHMDFYSSDEHSSDSGEDSNHLN